MRMRIALACVLVLLVATMAAAQFGRYRYRRLNYAKVEDFDGSFQFCRVEFRMAPDGDGGDWSVDWPRADENLSIRLSELTKTPVGTDNGGMPKHLLINLSSPELFHCQFIMMTEVGSIYLDDAEVKNLRDYLLKGGFLWADDFWGERAWAVFQREIRKVFPPQTYPTVDLPIDHPIFHSLMRVEKLPQIPSIGFYLGTGGTSERYGESATPHARAILDDHQRVMVFITHNTDFGDAFEREGESHDYFLKFSVPGYAIGVNVLLYALTH
jgi:hypothetical protein